MKKRQVIIANFLGGLAWGFGTVVGATVVVAILISVSKGLNIPVLSGVADQIENSKVSKQLQQDSPYR